MDITRFCQLKLHTFLSKYYQNKQPAGNLKKYLQCLSLLSFWKHNLKKIAPLIQNLFLSERKVLGSPCHRGKASSRWQWSPSGWEGTAKSVSRRSWLFQPPFPPVPRSHPWSRKNPLVDSTFSSNCFSAVEIVIFSFSLSSGQLPTYSPPRSSRR